MHTVWYHRPRFCTVVFSEPHDTACAVRCWWDEGRGSPRVSKKWKQIGIFYPHGVTNRDGVLNTLDHIPRFGLVVFSKPHDTAYDVRCWWDEGTVGGLRVSAKKWKQVTLEFSPSTGISTIGIFYPHGVTNRDGVLNTLDLSVVKPPVHHHHRQTAAPVHHYC